MKLFNSSGRMRRTDYFFHNLISLLGLFFVIMAADYINELISPDLIITPLVVIIAVIFYIGLEIVNVIKRFHDLNRKGSDLIYMFIPIYNIIIGLTLTFQAGTKGINNFGPDPRMDTHRPITKILINYAFVTAFLIFGIWSFINIEQKERERTVELFIEQPTVNSYLVIESENDYDPSYKYTILRVSSVSEDSVSIWHSDYVYQTANSAKSEIPDSELQFAQNFSLLFKYEISYLSELEIYEVVN